MGQGAWKTITFVAALRRHGMKAPQTIDGSMTGKKFLAYVERCLAPTLRRKDIVMIDNLPVHGKRCSVMLCPHLAAFDLIRKM